MRERDREKDKRGREMEEERDTALSSLKETDQLLILKIDDKRKELGIYSACLERI